MIQAGETCRHLKTEASFSRIGWTHNKRLQEGVIQRSETVLPGHLPPFSLVFNPKVGDRVGNRYHVVFAGTCPAYSLLSAAVASDTRHTELQCFFTLELRLNLCIRSFRHECGCLKGTRPSWLRQPSPTVVQSLPYCGVTKTISFTVMSRYRNNAHQLKWDCRAEDRSGSHATNDKIES